MDQIQHIVVLMLENRSFDSLLGRLYSPSAGFDGLTLTESNPGMDGRPVQVWNRRTGDVLVPIDAVTMSVPSPDPGELYVDMNTQIFGLPQVPDLAAPTMSGFVRNYVGQGQGPKDVRDPQAVMHYFSPDQVPVLSRLARQFAVCDRWHASAPCQTWPNRFFAHAATANGHENNTGAALPFPCPTIFGRLSQGGLPDPWHIYFHDAPQTLTLGELWGHLDRFRLYSEFCKDAQAGTLPSYSFIEPRYFPDVDLPNDQHSPHDVTLGEQLIASVYNSLRASPAWAKTLLIITYDEHGGCYDHVAPPKAVPPSKVPTAPFNFDRYGVRVPAVLVSPYIRPGTVLRPPPGGAPFDHTSIISTLRKRFNLGPPLTDRDASAPDLSAVFTLNRPDNMGPDQLAAIPYSATPDQVAKARQEPVNGMQAGLLRMASSLPQQQPVPGLASELEMWLQRLEGRPACADALFLIKQRLTSVFVG